MIIGLDLSLSSALLQRINSVTCGSWGMLRLVSGENGARILYTVNTEHKFSCN